MKKVYITLLALSALLLTACTVTITSSFPIEIIVDEPVRPQEFSGIVVNDSRYSLEVYIRDSWTGQRIESIYLRPGDRSRIIYLKEKRYSIETRYEFSGRLHASDFIDIDAKKQVRYKGHLYDWMVIIDTNRMRIWD